MNAKKTVYLIDGSAYIYRAYHAIRNLSSSKGLPTNAVFGFARMLIKLMEDKTPRINQFINGLPDGPVPFHYPARDYREELMQGQASRWFWSD